MRTTRTLLTLALAAAFAVQSQAHDRSGHPDSSCDFHTDYDVRVDAAGVAFTRASGTPTRVFMYDGELRVDGRAMAVSAADAARLRDYERSVRALLPEVAGIAREGMDIGFSALTVVATTFSEDGDTRARLLERLDRDHAAALSRIDAGLGRGVWTRHDSDDTLGASVEGAVSELVSTVTAGAVKAALSGDQTRIAALEARADALDKTIEKEVDARADQLEVRARALCPKLATLDQLQQQLEFRLPDGAALRLMDRAPDRDADHDHDLGKDKVAAR